VESDPLYEKRLLADIEAEKVILGSIFLNNELTTQATSTISESDFSLKAHRCIFEEIVKLHSSGDPINPITVGGQLADRGELERISGLTYLTSLIDGVPRTDSIEYYCRRVKEKAQLRQTTACLEHAISELEDGELDRLQVVERLQSKLSEIGESDNDRSPLQGVYPTLDDFFDAEIEEMESILTGAHRGEVASLVAMTNHGKTTLLLNVALSIAAGKSFPPIAPEVSNPRRVLYIDSESPAACAKADLQKMSRYIDNNKLARENFGIVVEASISGEPMNLSRPDHLKHIIKLAKLQRADLVIVDTVANAFDLQDENSNAEVTRRVIKPLIRLAREANCAVVFTHHIGKANETQTREAAYKGRGASAFGALPRTSFTIERDVNRGSGYIVLSCPKIKGKAFDPVLLRLNSHTRCFEACDDKPNPKLGPLTAQEIAEFVESKKEAHTGEIRDYFEGRASARTVSSRIAMAEQSGLIEKASKNKNAPWRLCRLEDESSKPQPEITLESIDTRFVQSASSISGYTNAQTDRRGNS
jgi:replicative DNA helicase